MSSQWVPGGKHCKQSGMQSKYLLRIQKGKWISQSLITNEMKRGQQIKPRLYKSHQLGSCYNQKSKDNELTTVFLVYIYFLSLIVSSSQRKIYKKSYIFFQLVKVLEKPPQGCVSSDYSTFSGFLGVIAKNVMCKHGMLCISQQRLASCLLQRNSFGYFQQKKNRICKMKPHLICFSLSRAPFRGECQRNHAHISEQNSIRIESLLPLKIWL